MMVSRSVVVGVGILVLVILGFGFFSGITGHSITSAVVADDVIIENEYFKIDELNEEVDLNGTQNSSGSG